MEERAQEIINRFMNQLQNQPQIPRRQQPNVPSNNENKQFTYTPRYAKDPTIIEKTIESQIHQLFACANCSLTLALNSTFEICTNCIRITKDLEKQFFILIFGNEKYINALSQFWKVGSDVKSYCGKILKLNDIGYKCYDCEMDPTCIICKECFQKGNHQGHRTVLQKGCSGCCDCGDIEAWKKEGFCSDHGGFLSKEKLSIEQIDATQRNNSIAILKSLFSQIFSFAEDMISQSEGGQQTNILLKNAGFQHLFSFALGFLQKLSMKNSVLLNLLDHVLCEQRFDSTKTSNFFRHSCLDIVSFTKIEPESTTSNKKSPNKHDEPCSNKHNSQCECSILELMLRYVTCLSNDVQEKLKNMFIGMFGLYHFKQNLISSYTKMFNFFFYSSDGIDSNIHATKLSISKFTDMSVQLFTSDILAAYVLEAKTDKRILDYFRNKRAAFNAQREIQIEQLVQKSSTNKTKSKTQHNKNSRKVSREIRHVRQQQQPQNQPEPLEIEDNLQQQQQEQQEQPQQQQEQQPQQEQQQEQQRQEQQENQQNEIEMDSEDIPTEANNQNPIDNTNRVPPNEDIERDNNDQMIDENVESSQIELILDDQMEDESEQEWESDSQDDEGDSDSGAYGYDEDDDESGYYRSMEEESESHSMSQSQSESINESKKNQQKGENLKVEPIDFTNEFFFETVLDKLLALSELSFKSEKAMRVFLNTYDHLRFITKKDISIASFVSKEAYRSKFVKLLGNLHFNISFQNRRTFETIYSNREYTFYAIPQETCMLASIRRIISYLNNPQPTATGVAPIDAKLANKLHVDFIKEIMKTISLITDNAAEESRKDLYSSLHVPLHRALAAFLMSYFKFDFNAITHPEIDKLARSLQLDVNQFKLFFAQQFKYPLSVAAFIKEIECGIWNNHGQEFKALVGSYIAVDDNLQALDTLFCQFAVKIAAVDIHEIADQFSNKPEYRYITKQDVPPQQTKIQKDYLSKQEMLIGKFTEFIIHLLYDTLSLFNYLSAVTHNFPESYKEIRINCIKPFLGSFMYSIKSGGINTIQKEINSSLERHSDLSTLLLSVATFNRANKNFQVMESFSKVCEPHVFFWFPKLKSDFIERITSNNQTATNASSHILGNLPLTEGQQSLLTNLIHNEKFFEFFEDILRQPYISTQFELKHSLVLQHLIVPILKLISLYEAYSSAALTTTTTNLSTLSESIQRIDKNVLTILEFTKQFSTYLGEDLTQIVDSLHTRIVKSREAAAAAAANRSTSNSMETEAVSGDLPASLQLSHQESAEAARKKLNMERQKRILEEFKQRSTIYSEKNHEILAAENGPNKDENCVICMLPLQTSDSPYGFGINASKGKLYAIAQLQSAQQVILYFFSFLSSALSTFSLILIISFLEYYLMNQATTAAYAGLSKEELEGLEQQPSDWSLSSCFHGVHHGCYENFLFAKNKKNAQQRNQLLRNDEHEFDFNCPLCNKQLNAFLPSIPSIQLAHKDYQKHYFNSHPDYVCPTESSPITPISENLVGELKDNEDTVSSPKEKQLKQEKEEEEHEDEEKKTEDNNNNNKNMTSSMSFILLDQLKMIELTSFQMEQRNSSNEEIQDALETILLNELRILDYEASPVALATNIKKLGFIRQVLHAHFANLAQAKTQTETFMKTRADFCREFLKVLTSHQQNKNVENPSSTEAQDPLISESEIITESQDTEKPTTTFPAHIDEAFHEEMQRNKHRMTEEELFQESFKHYTSQMNHQYRKMYPLHPRKIQPPLPAPLPKLHESDLKESYTKFLFYTFSYFKTPLESIEVIRSTILHVLCAKIAQLQLKRTLEKASSTSISNSFNDEQTCLYVMDIMHRVWNIIALFFSFSDDVETQLNQMFSDDHSELKQLLAMLAVNIPSDEVVVSLTPTFDTKEIEADAYVKAIMTLNNKEEEGHLKLPQNLAKLSAMNIRFKLIDLPTKFSDLAKKYHNAKCTLCKDLSVTGNLAICLICGQVICSISCRTFHQRDIPQEFRGNLNKHCIKFHCNESAFLEIASSRIFYISHHNNFLSTEALYSNSFGIPFKKNSSDWSQFVLDTQAYSEILKRISNHTIIDVITQLQTKENIRYRKHIY